MTESDPVYQFARRMIRLMLKTEGVYRHIGEYDAYIDDYDEWQDLFDEVEVAQVADAVGVKW